MRGCGEQYPEVRLAFLLGRMVVSDRDMREVERLLARPLCLDTLRRSAVRGKCLPLLLPRLSSLPNERARAIAAALAASSRYLDPSPWRHILRRRFAGLVRVASRHGLRLMGIKGLALMQLVPEYVKRSLNDLDMILPDLASLLRWGRLLMDRGLRVPEGGEAPRLVWRYWPGEAASGTPQLHLTVYGDRLKYDMHSGTLSLAGPLLEADLWGRAREIDWDGATAWVPSPEDCVLILLAHAVDHGYFTLKDFNDLYVILTSVRHSLDWPYLQERLKANGLDRLFSFTLDFLANHYDMPDPRPRRSAVSWPPAGTLGLWLARGGLTFALPGWGARSVAAGLMVAGNVRRRRGFWPASRVVVRWWLTGLGNEQGLAAKLASAILERLGVRSCLGPNAPRDRR